MMHDGNGWLAQGPSVSIDTACSSSLVGAHLACSSFLGPACPRALVAGVNLTLRAETTAVLAKAGMLAQVLPCCLPACLHVCMHAHSAQHFSYSLLLVPYRTIKHFHCVPARQSR